MVGNLCGKAPLAFLTTFFLLFPPLQIGGWVDPALGLGRGLLRGAGMSVLREEEVSHTMTQITGKWMFKDVCGCARMCACKEGRK